MGLVDSSACGGALIEFLSGASRRALGWSQRLGLELTVRFLSEPRRPWRRYLGLGRRIFVNWVLLVAGGDVTPT